jgi:uncharacterized membrane protein YkvA (DUF1232 family)
VSAAVEIMLGVAVSLAAVWLVLVASLLVARPDRGALAEAIRILPDTFRLIGSLAKDAAVPRGVRVRLWLLLAYLTVPFDLIPDFIPVLGYADDAILVVLVLRAVVRRAGPDVIRRHWAGTAQGLAALGRAAGVPLEGGGARRISDADPLSRGPV